MAELKDILASNLYPPKGDANIEKRLCGFGRSFQSVLQFSAGGTVTGEVYTIHADGTRELLEAQTTFMDGTPIADATMYIGPDTSQGHPSFEYYYNGEHRIVDHSLTKVVASGYYYLNEAGEIEHGTDSVDMIINQTLIAYSKTEGSNTVPVYFADERHGFIMDGATHLHLHETVGFACVHGGGLEGVANGSKEITGVTAGVFADEDLHHLIPAKANGKVMKMFYDPALPEWRVDYVAGALADIAIIQSGHAQYNDITDVPNHGLVDVPIGKFTVYTLWASNNMIDPYVWIPGQNLFDSRRDARFACASEAFRLELQDLPSPEMCPIAAVIVDSTGEVAKGFADELWVDLRRLGVPVGRY